MFHYHHTHIQFNTASTVLIDGQGSKEGTAKKQAADRTKMAFKSKQLVLTFFLDKLTIMMQAAIRR